MLRVDLPRYGWRTLHSHFLDWMITTEPVVVDALIKRINNQLTFDHWMLAIHEHRLLDCRVVISEDDQVSVGIGVPLSSGSAMFLFTVGGAEVGIDLAWVKASSSVRLDAELDAILGEVTG